VWSEVLGFEQSQVRFDLLALRPHLPTSSETARANVIIALHFYPRRRRHSRIHGSMPDGRATHQFETACKSVSASGADASSSAGPSRRGSKGSDYDELEEDDGEDEGDEGGEMGEMDED
jgi:hypothetical protein